MVVSSAIGERLGPSPALESPGDICRKAGGHQNRGVHVM